MTKIAALFLGAFLWIPSSNQQKQNLNIVGLWQANSPNLSSAFLETFRFYKNGSFTYHVNEYDDLNPLRAIKGTYTFQKNILNLKVSTYEVETGFHVLASDLGFQSGSFQIFGGKTTVVKQDDKTPSEHEVKILASTGKAKIELDNVKYYKLSGDPDDKFDK